MCSLTEPARPAPTSFVQMNERIPSSSQSLSGPRLRPGAPMRDDRNIYPDWTVLHYARDLLAVHGVSECGTRNLARLRVRILGGAVGSSHAVHVAMRYWASKNPRTPWVAVPVPIRVRCNSVPLAGLPHAQVQKNTDPYQYPPPVEGRIQCHLVVLPQYFTVVESRRHLSSLRIADNSMEETFPGLAPV
jgi:hypothetical protein